MSCEGDSQVAVLLDAGVDHPRRGGGTNEDDGEQRHWRASFHLSAPEAFSLH